MLRNAGNLKLHSSVIRMDCFEMQPCRPIQWLSVVQTFILTVCTGGPQKIGTIILYALTS